MSTQQTLAIERKKARDKVQVLEQARGKAKHTLEEGARLVDSLSPSGSS